MADDLFVDVRYRGLELGRRVPMTDFSLTGAYLGHADPMPVGTEVEVEVVGEVIFSVRVTKVYEQIAGADRPPGMLVEVDELESPAHEWWQRHAEGVEPSEESEEEPSEEPVESAEADDSEAEQASSDEESEEEPAKKSRKGKKKRRRKRRNSSS